MDGMRCLFALFPNTQVEKFLNDAVPIFKKKFYPVKRFLTNVNIAGVLNDWNGLVWVFVSFFFLILFDKILIKIEGFCLICYIKTQI